MIVQWYLFRWGRSGTDCNNFVGCNHDNLTFVAAAERMYVSRDVRTGTTEHTQQTHLTGRSIKFQANLNRSTVQVSSKLEQKHCSSLLRSRASFSQNELEHCSDFERPVRCVWCTYILTAELQNAISRSEFPVAEQNWGETLHLSLAQLKGQLKNRLISK